MSTRIFDWSNDKYYRVFIKTCENTEECSIQSRYELKTIGRYSIMKGFDLRESESLLIDFGIENNEIDDKIIKLFNLFLSSNSNYLYNKTYITDLIPRFIKNIEVLRDKKNECYKIADKLKENSNTNFFILVDNYFIIMPNDEKNVVSYFELCNNKFNKKGDYSTFKRSQVKKKMTRYLESLDLFNINEKNMKLRIFFKENDFVYTINNKLNKEDIENLSKEINIFIEECLEYEGRITNE